MVSRAGLDRGGTIDDSFDSVEKFFWMILEMIGMIMRMIVLFVAYIVAPIFFGTMFLIYVWMILAVLGDVAQSILG